MRSTPAKGLIASGDLRTADGRAAIERFFADFCADELRGPPKVLHADGHSFSDVARKVVSIINLASVAAVADMVGAPVDPLRFRGNLYVEGWPAWSELDLVGRELTIGRDARLKVVKRIVRCAATNVDPEHRAPRPQYSADADAQSRSRRLRDLRRGRQRRRNCGGGRD